MENIENVSALKNESTSYFSDEAYMMRCNSMNKNTANNSKNEVYAKK
jgi:hypothetical protein